MALIEVFGSSYPFCVSKTDMKLCSAGTPRGSMGDYIGLFQRVIVLCDAGAFREFNVA